MNNEKSKVQLDEIAKSLKIPRYFLGKVMNRLVKEGILDSLKGHKGGFCINDKTLSTKLLLIAELTGNGLQSQCALQLGACNLQDPCPVHSQVEPLKNQWNLLLRTISVQDLLEKDLLKSIATVA